MFLLRGFLVVFGYVYNTIQYNTIQYNTIQYNTIIFVSSEFPEMLDF